jgi:hypothetical protein
MNSMNGHSAGSRQRLMNELRPDSYIAGAWETLTRSMDECASLTDVKVMTHPVLYLPAGLAAPEQAGKLRKKLSVFERAGWR